MMYQLRVVDKWMIKSVFCSNCRLDMQERYALASEFKGPLTNATIEEGMFLQVC